MTSINCFSISYDFVVPLTLAVGLVTSPSLAYRMLANVLLAEA